MKLQRRPLAVILACAVVTCVSVPAFAQAQNPGTLVMPCKYEDGGVIYNLNVHFPGTYWSVSATYLGASWDGCLVYNKSGKGLKYEHAHVPAYTWPLVDFTRQVYVYQNMVDAGYDAYLGTAWTRQTSATLQYNCHNYALGVYSPLVVSNNAGIVTILNAQGYHFVSPPHDNGLVCNIVHSSRVDVTQGFDGNWYVDTERAKFDSSGHYIRIYPTPYTYLMNAVLAP